MTEEFKPHTRVRLKGDPYRQGIATGRTRPGRRDRGDRYEVKFPDFTEWVPGDQIESVPVERESPVDLLEQGKCGGAMDLRRSLTHVRLTGRLADVIYSMEVTNTDFYPYQFKPVLRFLHSPSNALLIADEVGLGKTIEAGLIWTELRSRFDLRRLLVLCPAMLREKWKRELSNKFGVRAEIVSAAQLHQHLQAPASHAHGYALVSSLEGARPHRGWDDGEEENASAGSQLARYVQSKENEPHLVDLLIIDEAHYLRNPESQTNELGRLFRPVSENLVLLTATPIHNHNQDLFALLKLLDANTFERIEDLEMILGASRPLVQARDSILAVKPSIAAINKSISAAESHPLLKGNRQLQAIREAVNQPQALDDRSARADFARRLEMVNPLAYVITRTRKRDVKEWRVVRDPRLEAVDMTPVEKRAYDCVTNMVIDYAMSRDANTGFLLATPQRQMSSSMAATVRSWKRRRDNLDDTQLSTRERESEDEIGPLTQALFDRVDEFADVQQLIQHDSKYERVQQVLKGFFADHPQEKVVLFSTFRETLNYLGERLAADSIPNIVMHGGIKEPKEEILERFEHNANIRLLLSSEVGSEGIDLQFCRMLINYDLPWNPMRVEQRIGRLDRLGQGASRIVIWNLLYAVTIDARIYQRLFMKLDLCRQALGDFEAVLGDEIRKLEIDLLSDHLTPAQEDARIDQTAQALANLKEEQEKLESESSHLVAYGDYIIKQVHAAHELNRHILGRDLCTYVIDFLKMHYPGCTFKQSRDNQIQYEIKLAPAAKADLENFVRAHKLGTSTQLTRPAGKSTACRFENRTGSDGRGHVELISQFHPLVRFVSDAITKKQEQLTPAVCVKLGLSTMEPQSFFPGDYVLAASLWSVEGLQASEKLVFAASCLSGGGSSIGRDTAEKLANSAAQFGVDWFEGIHVVDRAAASKLADEVLFGQLEADYEDFVADIERQNEDRVDLQLRNLRRHLASQLKRLLEVRDNHSQRGQVGLVKATEGRIDALKERVQRKEHEIEQRRGIRHRNREILVGLIRVEDDQRPGDAT